MKPRVAALLGLCLAACGPERTAPGPPLPRLVVLYVPCTVNRDCLSPYAQDVAFTPNLEAFAAQSLVFERHCTEAGQSGIAYASIFTGNQATRHGVYAHPKHVPESMYLVTEAFRDNGYDTFTWNGHAIGAASLNAQGVPPENVFEVALGRGHPAFLGLLDRLEQDPDYRAFVLTNFTATHAPYPTNWLERFCETYPEECDAAHAAAGDRLDGYLQFYARNQRDLSYDHEASVERLGLTREQRRTLTAVTHMLYRSNVAKLDWRFGRLVDEIDRRGLTDDSVVAFTVDHGEVMDRENALFRWTHGHALAPEVLNVPLILRAPGLGVEPGRYAEVTRSMDLFPTLAGLCGIDLPDDFTSTGTDLTPGILGDERPELLGYSHTSLIPHGAKPGVFGPRFDALYPRNDPDLIWVGVRDGDRMYKYRHCGDGEFQREVFDLALDPGETTNLHDPDDPVQQRMFERLERYKASLVADYTRRQESGDTGESIPNGERLDMLRSLGYIK